MGKANRLKDLVTGFAVGDALGDIFEFQSPSEAEIHERFHEPSSLDFTDDTWLLLSTLKAYKMSAHWLVKKDQDAFWMAMNENACRALVDWWEFGDTRGIGNTTLSAIKQMRRYRDANGTYDGFAIEPGRGYDVAQSAGNGVLSRALPLIGLGIRLCPEARKWLAMTHVHSDAISSAEALEGWMLEEKDPESEISDEAPGFYCVETLQIAVDAVTRAKTLYEVFRLSIRPDGDNDSNAALAVALWCWKHGGDADLIRIAERMPVEDRKKLEV